MVKSSLVHDIWIHVTHLENALHQHTCIERVFGGVFNKTLTRSIYVHASAEWSLARNITRVLCLRQSCRRHNFEKTSTIRSTALRWAFVKAKTCKAAKTPGEAGRVYDLLHESSACGDIPPHLACVVPPLQLGHLRAALRSDSLGSEDLRDETVRCKLPRVDARLGIINADW